MKIARHTGNKMHGLSTLVVLLISVLKITHQKTIVSPTPWGYQCDKGIGAFPHATDCQRQDDLFSFF